MINTKQKLILIAAILTLIGVIVWSYDYITKVDVNHIPEPAEKEKQSKKEPEKEELQEGVWPEATWSKYVNDELGFSIDVPDKVYGYYGCDPKKAIRVPVKVFEDDENGIVYISQEYYYKSEYDSELHKYVGECEKITNSLESFLGGWAISIRTVKNDEELDEFIKENYGPGCYAGDRKSWGQDGVYEIRIGGWDQWENLGTTDCPVNYRYKVLYIPEKNKFMSVKLGQESTFHTDPDTPPYQSYDERMINSFRFE